MSSYSKMKVVNNNTTKSRSLDFSDLQSSPLETKNPIHIKPQETKPQINTTIQKLNDEQHSNSTNKGRFGMAKLSRNRSVSVNMFRIEKQSTNAVKRVFSMRRSSSVSERYCRIHDQAVIVASPLHDDHSTSVKKKKKYSSSSILKDCKRLLGI